jgi:N-acetylneuraminic acid mutarotase
MTSLLPKPTVGAAAVWTGEHIYFFGGSWGGIEPEKFDTIIKFDPKIDNITIMSSKLPFGRSGLAATWDGEFIYLVGGSDGKQYSAEIYRYSPKNDTLETLPSQLPSGRLHIQAEYHNGSLYIFGGRGAPTVLYDQIVKYNLETDKVEIINQKLTNPSEFRMHAYDGVHIYVIGGFNGPKDINQFIIFTPGAESKKDTSAYCPPDESQNYIGIILLILIFIVAIILNFWHRGKKKQSNQ